MEALLLAQRQVLAEGARLPVESLQTYCLLFSYVRGRRHTSGWDLGARTSSLENVAAGSS